MLPAWLDGRYIGIPYQSGAASFEACDCWGLFSLAYQESGRVLPPYGGPLWYDRRSPGEPIGRAALEYAEKFKPVPAGEEQLYDAVLFAVKGFPIHCGMIVEPGRMLHIQRGADSCLEGYRETLMWRNRIVGFYRHV